MSEVVLLIHSTGTTPQMWLRLLDLVPLRIHALTPTNLGYAPNPPLHRGDAFHWSEDLAHLRASLPADATRVHLVGHSYGGLLAFKLAQELGDRLASMWQYEPVLFGSLNRERPHVDAATRQELEWLFDHPWFIGDLERGGSGEWQEIFIDYWNRPGAWQAMPQAARAAMLDVGWKMYQEVRATSGDDTPFSDYRLEAPITLVVGEHSPASPKAMAAMLAAVNPQTRIETVPGLGHMGPLLKPAALVDAFRRHFADVLA
ncbi:MAG TPA: alpha/beta hydrolase [Solimonas sp.]